MTSYYLMLLNKRGDWRRELWDGLVKLSIEIVRIWWWNGNGRRKDWSLNLQSDRVREWRLRVRCREQLEKQLVLQGT